MIGRLCYGLLLGAVSFFVVSAEAKFEVPWLSGPVIDEVGLLSRGQRAQIEQRLRQGHESGQVQLQVFITQSLQGLTIEQAAIDIVDQWQLGDKKLDNGVLFLIAPNERQLRIEVGQGLEGAIPDVYAKRIIEDEVLPLFRQNQMGAGVAAGVDTILRFAQGDAALRQAYSQPRSNRPFSASKLLTIMSIAFWIFFILMGRAGGRGSWMGHGGWGHNHWGGGLGGGGGGWSGGGGGFSGGGSSGRW